MVCLVDDDEVQVQAARAQQVREIHEAKAFERRDRVEPRPSALRRALRHLLEVLSPKVTELKPEALVEFSLPLRAKIGWADDKDSVGGTPGHQLTQDERGLNRLAETHLVGDEHPPGIVLHELEDRLELVDKELGLRAADRQQHIGEPLTELRKSEGREKLVEVNPSETGLDADESRTWHSGESGSWPIPMDFEVSSLGRRDQLMDDSPTGFVARVCYVIAKSKFHDPAQPVEE